MSKEVFLSYSSRDAQRAEQIADLLEKSGISVWWDRDIPPGKTWDAVLGKALDEAKCVVVLWTESSVQSDWVKDEASRGKRRNMLVPVLLDNVDIPLGFGRIESADLRNWKSDTVDPEYINFIKAIQSLIKQDNGGMPLPQTPVTPVPGTSFRINPWYLTVAVLMLAAALLGINYLNSGSGELVTELWGVEGDRKSPLLASKRFNIDDDLDKIDHWIVKELDSLAPVGDTAIQVNLHVPADLKTEAVQVTTEPSLNLTTFIYVVSGVNKVRVKSQLSQKRLALMEEAFFIEFNRTGYHTETIKIQPGEEKTKSFKLIPKQVTVAVERFNHDSNNIANRLSRKLVEYKHLKVTNPEALDNLRGELMQAREAIGNSRAIQNAIRDNLGVDFIVSGSLEQD